MASLEIENNDNVIENSKKRKSDIVVEKTKKKMKHSKIVDMKEETDQIIEKVKKKKKHVKVTENNERPDDVIEEQNITTTICTESNAKSKSKKVRELPTVTIAVPGSILDNAQSPEFRTYLAGQIARAACIYKIDEVCFVMLFYSFRYHETFS